MIPEKPEKPSHVFAGRIRCEEQVAAVMGLTSVLCVATLTAYGKPPSRVCPAPLRQPLCRPCIQPAPALAMAPAGRPNGAPPACPPGTLPDFDRTRLERSSHKASTSTSTKASAGKEAAPNVPVARDTLATNKSHRCLVAPWHSRWPREASACRIKCSTGTKTQNGPHLECHPPHPALGRRDDLGRHLGKG